MISPPDLNAALDALLRQIPEGRVAAYGDLAEALGDRSAARWVGERLVDHPHTPACACHRVVLKSGLPGNYIAGGPEEKLKRLRREGVPCADGGVDLATYGFSGFTGDRPLAALSDFQDSLPGKVVEEPLAALPEFVAGVDCAYAGDDGVAALAIVETATGRLERSATVRLPVRFPYITGYLAFREIELLLAVVRQEADLPPVIFVDGNGRLHPRRAGIATTLGVALDRTTIGVGKKLLCGSVDLDGMKPGQSRPILEGGETIGSAIRSAEGSKPVFVSVGNRIDLPGATELARRTFFGHRLPEAVYQADRLSKLAARS